jgi:hypothetical protein
MNKLGNEKIAKQTYYKIELMQNQNTLSHQMPTGHCACWSPVIQTPIIGQLFLGIPSVPVLCQIPAPCLLIRSHVVPCAYGQSELLSMANIRTSANYVNAPVQSRGFLVREHQLATSDFIPKGNLTDEAYQNQYNGLHQLFRPEGSQNPNRDANDQNFPPQKTTDRELDFTRKSTAEEVKDEKCPLSNLMEFDDSPKSSTGKKNELLTQDAPLKDPLESKPILHEVSMGVFQSSEKYYELTNLKNLYRFLIKYFRTERISTEDINNLSKFEIDIVDLIMQRKYECKLIDVSRSPTNLECLADSISNCQQRLSIKRSEESYKFIFTRAIKFLKKVFKAKNGLPKSMIDVDSLFYSHYFGSTASSLGLEIKSFVYPPIRGKKNEFFSCLNLNYFHQVFRCKKFMNDVFEYLKSDLRIEYDFEIERKTFQLLSKWDPKFTNDPGDESQNKKVMSEITHYFLRNKRCKLPWSLAEVNNAKQRLNALVEKLSSTEGLCQLP